MGLVTPRKSYDSAERYELQVSDEDYAKIRRGRWTETVTDTVSGKVYKLRGASCGLPRCFCDAVVIACS